MNVFLIIEKKPYWYKYNVLAKRKLFFFYNNDIFIDYEKWEKYVFHLKITRCIIKINLWLILIMHTFQFSSEI
jgi:hypothetical protein